MVKDRNAGNPISTNLIGPQVENLLPILKGILISGAAFLAAILLNVKAFLLDCFCFQADSGTEEGGAAAGEAHYLFFTHLYV